MLCPSCQYGILQFQSLRWHSLSFRPNKVSIAVAFRIRLTSAGHGWITINDWWMAMVKEPGGLQTMTLAAPNRLIIFRRCHHTTNTCRDSSKRVRFGENNIIIGGSTIVMFLFVFGKAWIGLDLCVMMWQPQRLFVRRRISMLFRLRFLIHIGRIAFANCRAPFCS